MGVINTIFPREKRFYSRYRNISNKTVSCNTDWFARNRIDNTIICRECIKDQPNSSVYDEEIHHYLYCGTGPAYKECSECCVVLTQTFHYSKCNGCSLQIDTILIPALVTRDRTPFYNDSITVPIATYVYPCTVDESDEDAE